MPWTQADLDAVETAIRAVRAGERKTLLSSETGALTYMNTPVPDLIKLRDAIRNELNATTPSETRRAAASSPDRACNCLIDADHAGSAAPWLL